MAVHEVSPGKSIQSAVDAARAGDVIRVLPGPYPERVKLRKDGVEVVSAEPAKAVTLGFEFQPGTKEITVRGFLCEGDRATAGLGSIWIEGSDHVVAGNTIRYVSAMSGVAMQFRQNGDGSYRNRNVLIEKNDVRECQSGIATIGHDITAQDNVIRTLERVANNQDADFFLFFGEQIRILRNACTDGIRLTGAAHTDGAQTYIVAGNPDAYARDVRIEGNLFSDADQGIMIASGIVGRLKDIVVLDNVFRNCVAWGISARGRDEVGGPEGIEVARNVFDAVNNPDHGGPAAVGVRGTNAFGTVRQNIFVRCNGTWFFSDGAQGQGIDNVAFDLNSRARMQPDDYPRDPKFKAEGDPETLAGARTYYTPTNPDVLSLHAGIVVEN